MSLSNKFKVRTAHPEYPIGVFCTREFIKVYNNFCITSSIVFKQHKLLFTKFHISGRNQYNTNN